MQREDLLFDIKDQNIPSQPTRGYMKGKFVNTPPKGGLDADKGKTLVAA